MEQRVASGGLRNVVVYGLFGIAAAAVGAYVGVSVDHQQNKPPTPALLFREERVPADGTSIIKDMQAGSVFYFSGSQFTYQNRSCANAQDLCVFLDTFSSDQ